MQLLRHRMNFRMRVICCFIALLIAGKEVVAFGHFSAVSSGVSMRDFSGEVSGDWVMECEEAPETESETSDDFTDSLSAGECDLEIRRGWSFRLTTGFNALPKFAVSEFYIHVLNLRL